jgi:hypothetical protein
MSSALGSSSGLGSGFRLNLSSLIIYLSCSLINIVAGGVVVGVPVDNSAITKFLKNEITSLSTAHNQINTFLREKGTL